MKSPRENDKNIVCTTPWDQCIPSEGSAMCLLPFGLYWHGCLCHMRQPCDTSQKHKGSILAMLLQFTSNFSQASKRRSVDSNDVRGCSHFSCGQQMLCKLSVSTRADKSKENMNNGKEWQAALLLAMMILNTSETHTLSFSLAEHFSSLEIFHSCENDSCLGNKFQVWCSEHLQALVNIPCGSFQHPLGCFN